MIRESNIETVIELRSDANETQASRDDRVGGKDNHTLPSLCMNAEVYKAHADVEAKHWWFAGRRQLFAAVAKECLATRANPLVVDIGCSIGNNATVDIPGRSYVGVDPSLDAISFAKEAHPAESFICGTVGNDDVDACLQDDLVWVRKPYATT